MNDKLPLNRQATDYIDPLPAPHDWARLTAAPAKPMLFATDIYFRECWAEAVGSWSTDTAGVARRLGLLIFKPDAIVGRRVERAVEFMNRHGFRVVHASVVHLNRYVSAELWRYNWNFATVDRIRLSTLLYDACDTLALIVANSDPAADHAPVPVSVRLSELKGSASKPNGDGTRMRELLGMPNRLLNFVHIADEPADIIRELGIVFDAAERQAVLDGIAQALDGSAEVDVATHASHLYETVREHDLDFGRSLERLVASGAMSPEAAVGMREASGSRSLTWPELARTIALDEHNRWDFLTVGTTLLCDEREGHADLLPGTVATDWIRGDLSGPNAGRAR
ncbi:hypothetical protein AB3X82_20515 [Paraburkholderia phenoliruptrix]|uniref:Nucleoside diphosphate kinase-like domain-containing protein n=2 Tax=Paraburkholderia phenoliruptrix TaxID=252970 RepID=A0ABV3WHP5_9BURK